jgi:hypothetical protein
MDGAADSLVYTGMQRWYLLARQQQQLASRERSGVSHRHGSMDAAGCSQTVVAVVVVVLLGLHRYCKPCCLRPDEAPPVRPPLCPITSSTWGLWTAGRLLVLGSHRNAGHRWDPLHHRQPRFVCCLSKFHVPDVFVFPAALCFSCHPSTPRHPLFVCLRGKGVSSVRSCHPAE